MTSFPDYKSAQEHQLKEWVEGRPWHNPWSPVASQPFPDNRAEGECCPDFSCCCPEGIWAAERRVAFALATDESRFEMLMGAISGLTRTVDDAVYVAGQGAKP